MVLSGVDTVAFTLGLVCTFLRSRHEVENSTWFIACVVIFLMWQGVRKYVAGTATAKICEFLNSQDNLNAHLVNRLRDLEDMIENE